jgi:ATP-dependent RNA helicase RhlE
MQFSDLGLSPNLLRAVLMEGYRDPTPIQVAAIPPILAGRDVMGCAQTGTGKTAAFALPALSRLEDQGPPAKGKGRRIRVLVLASTRELAQQIHDSFGTYGQYVPFRSTVIYGGVGQGAQVRQLSDGIDIVVATPGRLLDLIGQGFVDLHHVQMLILDEADRMLDMGFLPAIQEVEKYLPKKRQTLMFSATIPPAIADLAGAWLKAPVRIDIEPKRKTTELVEQSVCMVAQKQKLEYLIRLLRQIQPTRTLVFTRTKYGAERIADKLNAAGIQANAIHSNKSQNKRLRLIEQFKWDNPPVLVATDIAARGLDIDDVSHVFNFELPNEPETYVHRIGRSGRAGATGVAISLCDAQEGKLLLDIERLLGKKLRVSHVEPASPLPHRNDQKPVPYGRAKSAAKVPAAAKRPTRWLRGKPKSPRRR